MIRSIFQTLNMNAWRRLARAILREHRRRFRCFLPFIPLFLLTACERSKAPPWALPPNFPAGVAGDEHLKDVLELVRSSNNVPALAAVSMTSTGIIELAATGVRAFGFPEKVTENDRWHLGSITKPMTATLAARLVEKGLISWETTIAQAVPELTNCMRAEYRDVTLEELLKHQGGLVRDPPYEPLKDKAAWRGLPKGVHPEVPPGYDAKLSPTENRLKKASAVLALPPVGPRGKFHYSNSSFTIAGLMLERVAGMPFEELFRRELLEPLGMQSTGFGSPGTPGRRDQPWGHWPTGRKTGPAWYPLDPGNCFADLTATEAPNGLGCSSLQDMARFAGAHLAGARGHPGLLSVDSFRKLHTADTNGYALDWVVSTRAWAQGRWLYHAGSTLRWYACLTLAPDVDFSVFVACNAYGSVGERACEQAANLLLLRWQATRHIESFRYVAGKGTLKGAKQVFLHYGIDGWQETADASMCNTGPDTWEVVLYLPQNASKLDYCYTDGTNWDNNSGSDWHLSFTNWPH